MLKFMLKSSLCSQSLSCTCFCGWFSASCTRISEADAMPTPLKFGHNWQKISHKIKHKKIPRVHIFPILWSLWSKIFVFIYIIFLYSFIEFLPSNCSLYFRSRQRERSLNNILFYIEHLLEKWKKNAKAYDKNCHRQELGNAMIETAWKENIK